MAVTYEQLMALRIVGARVRYTDRETLLYALSVGMGRDPLDAQELPYVFEGRGLKTLPSMAAVLMRIPVLESGLDLAGLLHGGQWLRLHGPLPPAGELLCDSHIAAVHDKGAGRGAIVLMEATARNAADQAPLFTATSILVARGDGGCGGPGGSPPRPHAIPERAPDGTVHLETRPEQALLYRLNGDRNPLHADPGFAGRAGFRAPILHGLCSYGSACRGLLQAVAGYDHRRITGLDVRFTSPVFPGDALELDYWLDGGTVSFRCRLPARGVVALDNGRCTLTG